MTSLRRFTVVVNTQAKMDFVCQSISPEMNNFKVLMYQTHNQDHTGFPDISRFAKLNTLIIKGAEQTAGFFLYVC